MHIADVQNDWEENISARNQISDFWDETIDSWLRGKEVWEAPLDRWIGTYRGRGRGQLVLNQYPDPFAGDLRGGMAKVRMLVLGLNPGIGFDQLQSRQGDWARGILEHGYSRFLTRRPPDIPERWVDLAGRPSRYWGNLTKFAQRWLEDPTADVNSILNMELYPWHSLSVTAALRSPPDLVRRFVLEPLLEFNVSEVFAFGKEWFQVADALELRPLVEPHQPLSSRGIDNRLQWKLASYELDRDHRLIVSSQLGYAGPPAHADRMAVLRELVASS